MLMLNGDNIVVDVVAPLKREYLALPIRLIFDPLTKHRNVVRHWSVTPRGALVIFWAADPDWKHGIQATPFGMDAERATDFVLAWLEEQKYPEQPDHDGSNTEGFWLTTESRPEFMWAGACERGLQEVRWTIPAGSHYAIFAVKPEWVMLGK